MASNSVQIGFLQGLFEEAGTVSRSQRYVSLVSKSHRFVQQLQIVLAKFGILTYLERRLNETYALTIKGETQLKKFSEKIGFCSYEKTISLQKLLLWYCSQGEESKIEVPFVSDYILANYPREKIEQIQRDGDTGILECKPEDFFLFKTLLNGKYSYQRITEIRADGREAVFSVRVDSNCHSFTANGFINHNTEARMNKLGEIMMEDIDKNTVNLSKNYDETLDEPTVLPARIPNLLVNGTDGIAVGFASKMPPHNISEVIDGVIAKIDNPSLDSLGLMQYIKGPDFPMGGTIRGTDGIVSMYTTGKGSITVQSDYEIEDAKGGRQQIVFTTVPYMVMKESIVQNIQTLARDKVIEGIADVRDETSKKDGIRIVVEVAKTGNVANIIRKLYKKTQLQNNFAANMIALDNDKNGHLIPHRFLLDEIIDRFIRHRKEVIQRKYEFLLAKAKARLHIVDGILKAIDVMDEVVKTIRSCKSQDEANEKLRKKFDFSELQAKAILAYRLNQLVGLEIEKFKNERTELLKSIEKFEKILSSEKNILAEVKRDVKEVQSKYGDERITKIDGRSIEKDSDDGGPSDDVEDKEMVITITNTGYIKSVPLDVYSAQARGGKGSKGVHKAEIDVIKQLLNANKRDVLLCVGSNGRMYKLLVSEISEVGKTSRGDYLNNLIGADSDVEILSVIAIHYAKEYEGFVFFFTEKGGVKKIDVKDLVTNRRSVLAIKTKDEDNLLNACYSETDNVMAFVATENGKLLKFRCDKLNAKGRAAGTQRCIKLKDGDIVVSADLLKEKDSLLTITNTGIAKRTLEENYRESNLGGSGTTNYKTDKKVHVASVITIDDSKDILVACDNGKLIRIHADALGDQGRVSKGARLVKLENGEQISVASAVVRSDDENEAE